MKLEKYYIFFERTLEKYFGETGKFSHEKINTCYSLIKMGVLRKKISFECHSGKGYDAAGSGGCHIHGWQGIC